VLQDPLNAGRSSGTESASARSLAVAHSTLSKVLGALRNTSAGAGSLGQVATASVASAAVQQQQQQQQLQHVPWRDSPLTRWLQEQLHAANAILLLGTITTDVEVGGWGYLGVDACAEAPFACLGDERSCM
jgi:kinesin family protein 4/21/27